MAVVYYVINEECYWRYFFFLYLRCLILNDHIWMILSVIY